NTARRSGGAFHPAVRDARHRRRRQRSRHDRGCWAGHSLSRQADRRRRSTCAHRAHVARNRAFLPGLSPQRVRALSLPRKPLAVVFDLDGTLIDSEALVRDAYRHTSQQFGVTLSDAQFLSLVGLNRDDNDAQLRGYWGADFPLAAFHEANRAHLLEQTAPLK